MGRGVVTCLCPCTVFATVNLGAVEKCAALDDALYTSGCVRDGNTWAIVTVLPKA